MSDAITDQTVRDLKQRRHSPWGFVSASESLATCDRFSGSSPEQWRQDLLQRETTKSDKQLHFKGSKGETHHSSGLWGAGWCFSSWPPPAPTERAASPAPHQSNSWSRSTAKTTTRQEMTLVSVPDLSRWSSKPCALWDPAQAKPHSLHFFGHTNMVFERQFPVGPLR